jgi:hypothetical protein
LWLLALSAVASPNQRADLAVVGVLDTAPEPGVSALLDEAAGWLQNHTALSVMAGDQAGLDRSTIAACPADLLYTCLAKALLRVTPAPCVGLLVARARSDGVLLLVFEAEVLAAGGSEEEVYERVRRVSGRSLSEALEGLRTMPTFEPPVVVRIEARGCEGCSLRIAGSDVALPAEQGRVEALRLRPGLARLELSSAGASIASLTATMSAGRPWLVRVDVPQPAPWWRPVLAASIALGGAVSFGSGIAVAAARADLVCVSHAPNCVSLGAGDPRVDTYRSTGDAARALGITGALAMAGGLAWWLFELAADEEPSLVLE